jgi:hypothetical protein
MPAAHGRGSAQKQRSGGAGRLRAAVFAELRWTARYMQLRICCEPVSSAARRAQVSHISI